MHARPDLVWASLACAATLAAFPAHEACAQPAGADSARRDARRDTRADVTLALSGYVQADARWVAPAPRGANGPLLRRARLLLEATSPSGWGVRLQPDFGFGRAQVQDAFVSYRRPALEARVGRFRPAFGIERTQGSSTLLFPERSVVNTLMPSRMLGAQLTVVRDRLTATLGGFGTAAARDAGIDTDGDPEAGPATGHDVVGRVVWRPSGAAVWGGLLDVHGAAMLGATRGTVTEAGLSRLLTVGQQPALVFAADSADGSPARADGRHVRLLLGVRHGGTRHLIAAEAVAWTQRVARGDERRAARVTAWVARGARVWRGTRAPADETRLDPSRRGGAVELGARIGVLTAGAEARRLAAPGSAMRFPSAGVAASWIPRALTRLSLSYDATARRDTGPATLPGRTEHAVVARVQQGF